ncbi:putative E3 ubiquitin-protein ligase UBR7 [Armadillidium vulgare]|nr:putative E3 ubiquitin-protein ligase UBR7 [Armadillidium vulgare]
MNSEACNDQGESISKETEDSGITMVDVLQEEEELESSADAVLGAWDDSACSFKQGYVKRQPLYACMTCCPITSDVNAGICLACSYHCHEGHELEKPSSNTDNKYNQNFKGKYCTCSRPYPDPEDPVEDNMIQCIICEDWYHGRNKTANNEDIVNEENISLNSEVTCKIKEAKDCSPVSETLFLKENWRKDLCTCGSCDELYKNLKVSFLVDPEDTVTYYESQGRSKRALAPSGVQREIDALSSLDRITRTELVHEYNNLSTSLRDYLRKFAENGKVVRDEDIREFFSQLSANKKQKKDSFQYFCK